MEAFLSSMPDVLATTIRMTVPLLFVALGELFSERAGLVNIGLDGLMTIGAFTGFVVGYQTGNLWLGVLCGAVAGIAVNMVYAFCTVSLRVDQTVTGMAINILAPGIATFAYKVIFGDGSTLVQGTTMDKLAIPGLSAIPFVGDILFNQTLLAYLAYIAVPLCWFYFARTRGGLNFRSVGENPQAAETLGIDAIRTKYLASVVCGALAGIGGAFLTLCYTSTYATGVVAGRGFIALAAVIFGRWSSVGILGATLLFGFFDAVQIALQVSAPAVPYQFFAMIPYVFTIVALFFFNAQKGGPKANGKPYFREER
ncbi:ABC transporter permease [Caniella muris]|uniref:ABC transporter permease n=1 Tax=Caniella muris TaxID=2941502 RepID=UPI00203B1245|nr:ABC transporter permease [Caniella muris]